MYWNIETNITRHSVIQVMITCDFHFSYAEHVCLDHVSCV